MKIFKRLFISLSIFITLVVILYLVWRLLLWRDDHRNIELGNVYVANIESYRQQHNKLPDERDRDTLRQLNPYDGTDERRRPEYRVWSGSNFTLSFIQGFD